MSGEVTVKISGLDELQKKLEAIPRNLAKEGLKAALHAGGDVIQEGFVANAPHDTGFLSEHFNQKVKLLSNELAGKVYIGPAGKIDYPDTKGGYREKINRKGKKYKVGRISVASVCRFLEFGTSKMAKRPFMTQTFEERKGSALDAIVAKLRDVFAKVRE